MGHQQEPEQGREGGAWDGVLHLPEASIRLFVFLLGFWIEVSLRTLPAGSGATIHSAGQKLQALGAGPVESRAPNPRHDPAYLHSRLLSAGPASFPCGGAQSSVSIQCRAALPPHNILTSAGPLRSWPTFRCSLAACGPWPCPSGASAGESAGISPDATTGALAYCAGNLT